jgi:hypothetical protein
MRNNTNLNALVLNKVLTTSEMKLVKGGTTGSGQNSQTGQNNQNVQNAQNGSNVNTDDKRRERPGGGIATH